MSNTEWISARRMVAHIKVNGEEVYTFDREKSYGGNRDEMMGALKSALLEMRDLMEEGMLDNNAVVELSITLAPN